MIVLFLKPGFFVLKRQTTTALLVAELVAYLANFRLEGTVFYLFTEIPLICVLILSGYGFQSADLVNMLHAFTHLRICQRTLATSTASLIGEGRRSKRLLHIWNNVVVRLLVSTTTPTA